MTTHPPAITLNPLWVKGLRERCRPKHMLTWGIIWLTLATFVFLVTYITMVEQQVSSKADAAKAALPGILVIQAVILMLFGTGAVASGVSQERDEDLLAYIRMTPMSPTAKVIGYLFGLPAREYLLVGATMPLVLIIVIISGFSLFTLGHFYLVFFTSVLVYHMTALVVGMVSPKPRLSSLMSMGLVVLLYFALPNLSRLGITFFEFLTIRPTFLGLVQQELPLRLRAAAEINGIDTYRPVPFFGGAVGPTVYTLMVQGFLVATMFSILHRKWRDQANHLFSKPGSLIVFSGVAIFTFASIWAVVSQDDAYARLFDPFATQQGGGRVPETLFVLLMVGFMIVCGAYIFMIAVVTPTKDRTKAGIRQARRRGETRLRFASDAGSSLPVAVVMIAICIAFGVSVIGLAVHHGDYITSAPSVASMIAVVLLLVSIGLFVQGVAERASIRVFGVAVFLLWMIPFFVMVIMFAAFEAFEAGLYVGQPFPPVSIGFSMSWMLETAAPPPEYTGGFRFLPSPNEVDLTPSKIAYTGAVGYAAAAALMQVLRFRHRKRLWSA
jgi:hypothetical protein